MSKKYIKKTKYIKKAKTIIIETYYVTKNFGIKYGAMYLFTSIFRKYQYLTRRKAISIIESEYSYLFEKYRENKNIQFDDSQKNIFLYWAKGFDELPSMQREVIYRIKKIYPDYNLYFIDDENYSKYVSINENIINLYKQNKISVQTFSDILRFNLVYKYGGIWCDMTNLFFSKVDFSSLLKNYEFWSINHESYAKTLIWGKVYPVTYTTFLFAAVKNCYIMKICVEFYNDYYKIHDYCIDYFMNDFILILCMKKKVCNDIMNRIPKIKSSPFLLDEAMEGMRDVTLDELKMCPQKLNNKKNYFECVKKYLENIEEK